MEFPQGWIHSPSAMTHSNLHSNLVRFGEVPYNGIPRPKLRCPKRKLDFEDVDDPQPWKMYISEEKMTDQLKNMHISNNVMSDENFEDDTNKCESLLPTVSLSKEVQSLSTLSQSIIPEAILEKMENPTRALVLWQPPAGSLPLQLIQRLRHRHQTEDKTANTTTNINNNTTTADLNMSANQGLDMEL